MLSYFIGKLFLILSYMNAGSFCYFRYYGRSIDRVERRASRTTVAVLACYIIR